MKTAVDTIKDLQVEVKQLEHRRDTAKTERDSLERQKDLLAKDAAETRIALEADVQRKMTLLREETNKMNGEKDKLVADKAEFVGILQAFKADKLRFEDDRQKAIDAKANYDQMTEKVGMFVRLMKMEAAKL